MRRFLFCLLTLLMTTSAWGQIINPSPQSTGAQSSGACTSGTNCATWNNISSFPSVTFQITGTFSETMTFEGTSDGQTWFSVLATKLSSGVMASTATTTGQYSVLNSGLVGVRARCTTHASGAANISLTRGTASSANKLFDLSNVTGVLAAVNGGTGQSLYAIGDVLSADTTTTLSKVAAVAKGRFFIAQGTSTLPAYAAATDIFLLKDGSGNDGSVGIGTATPNIGANAGTNRVLTVFGADRNTFELATSTDADGTTVGNLIASNSTQSTTSKRIAEIRFKEAGTTANNRGGRIELATRVDNAATGISNPSIQVESDGSVGIGVGIAGVSTAALTVSRGALTNGITLSGTTDVLRFSASAGTISMSGGGTWTGSGNLSVTPSTLFDLTTGAFSVETKPLISATNPTIASGFGTTGPPSISATNTFAFTVTVGTNGTDSVGAVTMPAATNGYSCVVADLTTPDSFNTKQVASTSTLVSFKNYSMTLGTAVAWTAGDVLTFLCGAR